MAEPRLVDAVTLRHFGVLNRMDVLGARLSGYPLPRWTQAVQEEIFQHLDEDDCSAVLAAPFMGNPRDIPGDELAEVFRIQRALSTGDESPTAHLGEAESIWIADRLNGTFITDDSEAFEFAEKRF